MVSRELHGIGRRSVLKGGIGLAALSALPGLAACGADDAAVATTVGGRVDYLGWEGEHYPKILQKWLSDNDVTYKASFMGNMNDIPPKFAGGGSGIDLISYASMGTQRLLESGVPLRPLTEKDVPNLAGISESLATALAPLRDDNGALYGVPHVWGSMGISYDSTKIDAPTSWEQLLGSEFKNQIAILDDPSTAIGLGAVILGIEAHRMSQADLEEIKGYLRKFVAQAKQITLSFGDMANVLASGEVVAAWGGYPAIDVYAAAAGNDTIRTQLVLEEGSGSFAEVYAVPESADNAVSALAIIDQMLTPDLNAAAADTMTLAPSVEKAWDKVGEQVTTLFPRDQVDQILVTAPMVMDPPAKSDEFVTFAEVTAAWEEIKAGV